MLRPLLLFLFLTSCCGTFRARLLLRLMCYDHPSSLQQNDQPCDSGSSCDPELVFCLFNSTFQGTCNIGRLVFDFRDQSRLGACRDTEQNNVPNLLPVDVETQRAQLGLRLVINDLDRVGLFERRAAIDELIYRLLPADLKTLPSGRSPQQKDFVTIRADKRSSESANRPRVEIGAVVVCPKGWFGTLCSVKCSPNEQFGCLNNGSRQCRPGWGGPDCSLRDFCASRPCKAWAQCHSLPGGFECSCNGAVGPQCRRDGDPCLNNRCANGSSCLSVSGRPVCHCQPGRRGQLCLDVDPCSPNPCGPRGRCREVDSEVRCECPPGVSGPFCNVTLPTEVSPNDTPHEEGPQTDSQPPMALLLLFIFFGILLLAAAAVAIRCYCEHRQQKDTEHYPSLTTLSTQRTSPYPSVNTYDDGRMSEEGRLSTELPRLSAEEGVYEDPGPLYSVREEDEDEVEGEEGEDEASTFGSVSEAVERSRLPSGSRSVRFVRA